MAKTKTTKPLDPSKVLDDILDKFTSLPGVLGTFGDALTAITESFKSLFKALGHLELFKLSESLQETSKKASPDDTVLEKGDTASNDGLLIGALGKLTASLDRIAAILDRLLAYIGSRIGPAPGEHLALPGGPVALPQGGKEPLAIEGGKAAPPASPSVAASAGTDVLGSLAAVGAVAAAALGAVAITAGLLEREFHKLEGFVRLFNPAVITLFHQALDNLGATIGRAFVPVFQDLTEVIRQYAAILKPILAELAPVIKQFADLFSNILVSVLQQFGNLFRSMLPAIRQFADMMLLVVQVSVALFNAMAPLIRGLMLMSQVLFELSGLGTIIRVLNIALQAFNQVFQVLDEAFNIFEVVINTIVSSLLTMITSIFPVKEIMDALTKAIQYVIRNMYVFAVMLAKLAGLDSVVDALIKSIATKLEKGDTAAQTPSIKGLEQLAKDLALASATAGGAAGGGGVKNQQEFWKGTLDAMKEAQKNGISIKDILLEIKAAVLRLLPGGGSPAKPPGGGGEAGKGGLPGGILGGGLGGIILRGALGGR